MAKELSMLSKSLQENLDLTAYSQVGHIHDYAGSSTAGGAANTAVKLHTARTINGTSFDGSRDITTANWGTARNITIGDSSKSVNGSGNVSWTLTEIGAAAESHGTHVTYSTTAPLVAGTAAVGSATNVSRGDHVHPAQTSVSGNAGTATKLATARTITIGNKSNSFDGSDNISYTLSEIGAFPISGGTVTGDTIFNKHLSVNAWPGYGSGSVDMWYDGTYSDNIGALTLNKSIFTEGAVETNNLLIDAWPGYGTGYADLWYDGTNKTIYMDHISTLRVGNNKVYHEGYKPTLNDIGAAASSHDHNSINYQDTRSVNTAAEDVPAGLSVHLKSNGTDGISDGGSYHPVLMMKPWGDKSGWPVGQLAVTQNNNLYFRVSSGADDTSWNAWKKVSLDGHSHGSAIQAVASNLSNVTISGYDSMMTAINSNLSKL